MPRSITARLVRIGAVLAAAALATTPASATVYSNEALFQTAAGSVATENFESFAILAPVTALPALGITFGPLSGGFAPTVTSSTIVGGVNHSPFNVLQNNEANGFPANGPITIFANTGTLIFALGYWNVGGDDTTTLAFFDAANNLIESGASGPADPEFIGIVSAIGAAKITISPLAGNGWITIDDLQVRADAIAVPAPAALGVTLLALGGFFSLRRRRR